MDDGQPSAELPEESETLTDKMSRYFSNEASSVSMVPPSNSSYLTKNIFTDDHRKYLLKVCGNMVKSGIISKTVVKDLLSKDEEGKEMLREFTIEQLINRLKYERRLNRRKWTNSATCQTTYFCMSLLDLQSDDYHTKPLLPARKLVHCFRFRFVWFRFRWDDYLPPLRKYIEAKSHQIEMTPEKKIKRLIELKNKSEAKKYTSNYFICLVFTQVHRCTFKSLLS